MIEMTHTYTNKDPLIHDKREKKEENESQKFKDNIEMNTRQTESNAGHKSQSLLSSRINLKSYIFINTTTTVLVYYLLKVKFHTRKVCRFVPQRVAESPCL